MRGSKRTQLALDVTATLLRVVNQIHLGRRTPRNYGEGRKMTLIETEMCTLIAEHEGITGAQISQKLGVTRSATSQYISKLKESGCVKIVHDESNAKMKKIYLTDIGKRSATLSFKYTKLMEEQIYTCPDEELLHYLNFVKKLEKFHKKVVEMLMADNDDEDGAGQAGPPALEPVVPALSARKRAKA